MKRYTAAFGGVLSTLANKYEWEPETLLAVRLLTVITTVLMGWPLFVYLILILFKRDL